MIDTEQKVIISEDERKGLPDRRSYEHAVLFDRRINENDRRAVAVGDLAVQGSLAGEDSVAPVAFGRSAVQPYIYRKTNEYTAKIPEDVCAPEAFSPKDTLNASQRYLHRLYMRERGRYVQAMGWFASEQRPDDADAYDMYERTRYILSPSYGKDGSLRQLSGMRLTQVPSFKNSLTWSMLRTRQDLEADILQANQVEIDSANRAAKEGKLWDLTRLVVSEGASLRGRATMILELIGAGLGDTCPDLSSDAFWFFFTTKDFQEFLTSAGIQHRVMARVTMKEGEAESILCITQPAVALEYLRNSENKREQYAYRVIERARQARSRLN